MPGEGPDIHLRIWVGISAAEPHDRGIVIEALKDAVDQGAKFKRNDMHLHAEVRQIVLEQGCHLHALAVRGVGDDREFDWPSMSIEQLARGVPRISSGLEQLACAFDRPRWMRDGCVDPEFIARPDIAPQGCSARPIDQAHDGLAIHCCRDRLTKFQVAKPGLFAGNFVEFLAAEVVQIEQQEVIFEAGTHIRELRAERAISRAQASCNFLR